MAVRRTRCRSPLALLTLLLHTCAAGLQNAAVTTTTAATADDSGGTVVHKCCGHGEIVVVNRCRDANITGYTPWTPEFTASREDDAAAAGQKTLPASSVAYK